MSPRSEARKVLAHVKAQAKAHLKSHVKTQVKAHVKAHVKAQVKVQVKAEVNAEVNAQVSGKGTECAPPRKTQEARSIHTGTALGPACHKEQQRVQRCHA
jgi:hypothetical protein